MFNLYFGSQRVTTETLLEAQLLALTLSPNSYEIAEVAEMLGLDYDVVIESREEQAHTAESLALLDADELQALCDAKQLPVSVYGHGFVYAIDCLLETDLNF
jgi:hypothetical protein